MSASSNSRLAMTLFFIYLVLYSGFILLNLFAYQVMETRPFADINLAIWYGFGLIFSAILLAGIYGIFCKPAQMLIAKDAPNADGETSKTEGQA